MDETVIGALETLGLTSATAEYWRSTLHQVQQETLSSEAPDDWDAFSQRFVAWVDQAGLPSDAAHLFLEYAAQTQGIGLVDQILMLSDDQIAEYCAQAGWARLITEHGADWAGYDGSQPHWDYFRDLFYNQANAIDPQVYAMAYEQLSPYDAATPLERYHSLHALGLPVDPAAAEPADGHAAAEPTSFDEMTVDEVEQMILLACA
ncbi:hypothetical protein EES43_02925 [Streptomyces sp. ADI96-02]|uniref:hypothetical protein n=1 Tax=Streptomyces sp. ADI96-02 TaxID=1522760 RepID=UPI000F55063A|nr:hypothetical protein [Streptomyces sp. ADI96-02]RPK67628.1 hypothetical protein EES43_02925 [Streptomyces sp. ADI96-02]